MSCALFKHEYCVFIRILYTQKSCTWLLCLNNVWHLCVNNMNPWNNRFCMDLEQTHEAYKFVMPSISHIYVNSNDIKVCIDYCLSRLQFVLYPPLNFLSRSIFGSFVFGLQVVIYILDAQLNNFICIAHLRLQFPRYIGRVFW